MRWSQAHDKCLLHRGQASCLRACSSGGVRGVRILLQPATTSSEGSSGQLGIEEDTDGWREERT